VNQFFASRNIIGTFKQTGWRYSSRQFCYCVIGGVDVARRIGVLAPDHLAVRLLIVLTLSPPLSRSRRSVTGLSVHVPAQRAGAQRLRALAQSGDPGMSSLAPLLGDKRTLISLAQVRRLSVKSGHVPRRTIDRSNKRERGAAALRKRLDDVIPATTSPCYKEAAVRGFAAASISRKS